MGQFCLKVEFYVISSNTLFSILQLKEDPSFKPQGGRFGENDMDYDTDEKSMATLRRRLRIAREEYCRYRRYNIMWLVKIFIGGVVVLYVKINGELLFDSVSLCSNFHGNNVDLFCIVVLKLTAQMYTLLERNQHIHVNLFIYM